MRYIFKLIGFSKKDRLKMRQLFRDFVNFKYKRIFLSVYITIIIISDLAINIRSTVLKMGVFRSVQIVYFR